MKKTKRVWAGGFVAGEPVAIISELRGGRKAFVCRSRFNVPIGEVPIVLEREKPMQSSDVHFVLADSLYHCYGKNFMEGDQVFLEFKSGAVTLAKVRGCLPYNLRKFYRRHNLVPIELTDGYYQGLFLSVNPKNLCHAPDYTTKYSDAK